MQAVLAVLLLAAAQGEAASAPAPAPDVTFSRKTEAQGPVLQVVFGERAVIRLDDQAQPVVVKTDRVKLALAHPAGTVQEVFAGPAPGEIAVALDGSAQTKKTVLKVWNGQAEAVRYEAVALVLSGGKLTPRPVGGCAVPAKGSRTQSWPAPVVAVALTKFTAAPAGDAVCK